MLIKLQEGYLNIKKIKRMTIAEENILCCSRIGFEGILVYSIIIYTGSSTEYVARYQEKQDAEAELERFKRAWTAGDTEFEFAADDELTKRINDCKKQLEEELHKELIKERKEREQKYKEQYEQLTEQIEADNALTKFFCYIGALLIFCLTTYAGSRCIESPQLLVSAGIIAGAIGGALISHAMRCGKDD